MNNRNTDGRHRRGCMDMAFGRWENFPYYTGPCPCGGVGGGDLPPRRRRPDCGIFMAFLPLAISANGIIPLVVNNPCRDSCFAVNSGLVTVEERGTYLATYTVRLPEGAAVDTTVTLNVDDASQTSAITQISGAGEGTSAFTAQAIFEADEGATVALRTSDAISVTEPSVQPMFTLSLVRLDS